MCLIVKRLFFVKKAEKPRTSPFQEILWFLEVLPWEPKILQVLECIFQVFWTEQEIAQWNVKNSVIDCSIDPKVTTIVTRNFQNRDVEIQVIKMPV